MMISAYWEVATIPAHLHFTARVLQIIFLIGVAGCLISIPIIAVKFASVLFERGDEGEDEGQAATPEDDEANYGAVDPRVPKSK